MAEANTSSTQQAADAQHVDNMTSMQQPTPDAPSGARSDAPVQTNNVGAQDGPSQLNSNPTGNSTSNNNLGGGQQNSPINGGSSGNLGGGAGPGGADAGGAGGALNGLAGNAGGEASQGGTGNTAGGSGGGAGNAGVTAAASARGAGGFGGGGAGDAGAGEASANGTSAGGGEGGGGSAPSATANAPTSPANTTIPFDALTAEEFAIAAVDAPTESNSSGQPIPKTQYTLGQLSMVLTDPLGWSHATSSDYGFTPLSNITGANGQLNIDVDGVWLYTLSALPSSGSGALTDTFRLAFNYQFSDSGNQTGYVDLTVNVDSSSEPGRLIYSTAAAYSADSPPSLAPNFELLAFITPENNLSASDHINLLAQGVMSGLTEVNSSEPGNIGVLTADNFGRYTYSINQVSVDSIGQYAPVTPVRYDTLVLTHFTNLFYQGSNHTDTFNVTTTVGNSTVDVHIGNTIIGMVINDNVPASTSDFQVMSSAGGLGLAPGSQSVSIISGGDASNFYINNIGSLSLSPDGAFTYTITSAAISAWELNHSHLGYASDLFLVSSTVGNIINIQALEFSIMQESDTTVMSNSSSVESGRNEKADIYLFNTWDSIYSSPSTPYSHTINNFEIDYDRINISNLLTSSTDLLSGKIYIDPLNGNNSRSEIHVNEFTIANISRTQASIPELMWNEAWSETPNFAPVTSLNAVLNWTETLEISGVTSYDEAQKTFSVVGAGGWTMQIVSSDEISISSSGANRTLSFGDKAGEVVFSQTIGGETYTFHDISHVDKINWQATV